MLLYILTMILYYMHHFRLDIFSSLNSILMFKYNQGFLVINNLLLIFRRAMIVYLKFQFTIGRTRDEVLK